MTAFNQQLQGIYATTVSVLILGLVFSPLWRRPPRDDFPLSNYPMFSHRRDPTNTRIIHVIGLSTQDRHRPLPPELVGTDEVMQAHQTINVAIARGPATALRLCERAAKAVIAEGSAFQDLKALQVRTDDYDALAYFSDTPRPHRTQIHATCPVIWPQR